MEVDKHIKLFLDQQVQTSLKAPKNLSKGIVQKLQDFWV